MKTCKIVGGLADFSSNMVMKQLCSELVFDHAPTVSALAPALDRILQRTENVTGVPMAKAMNDNVA